MRPNKLRKTKKIGALLILGLVVVVGFQNCNSKLATDCEGTSCQSESTKSSGASASTESGGNVSGRIKSGSSSLGGMGSGTGSMGSSNAGSSGSNGGNSMARSSSGDQASSTAGSGGTLGVDSVDKVINLALGEYVSIQFQVSGGKSPLKYQWYKDDVALKSQILGVGQLCNTFAYCGLNGDNYQREGKYRVEVTDASGAVVKSGAATVNVIDVQNPCEEGTYTIHSGNPPSFEGVNFDLVGIKGFFENSRGKFLYPASHRAFSAYIGSGLEFGFVKIEKMPKAAWDETVEFASLCTHKIPSIHTPMENPGLGDCPSNGGSFDANLVGYSQSGVPLNTARYDWANYSGRPSASYHPGCGYKITGGIKLKCQNNKWKFVENTCGWAKTTP